MAKGRSFWHIENVQKGLTLLHISQEEKARS